MLHRHPLVMQIQRQRAGAARAALQHGSSSNNESEARHALNAFVAAADQPVDAKLRRIQRHTSPKLLMAVFHDELAAMPAHDLRQLLQRIENAGRRLAVNDRDMRNLGIGLQSRVQLLSGETGDTSPKSSLTVSMPSTAAICASRSP